MSSYTPSALITSPIQGKKENIILLPTPNSATVTSYCALFRSLHQDKAFCLQAFGPAFGVDPEWTASDEVTGRYLGDRDAALRWKAAATGGGAVGGAVGDEAGGMGDFAVGVYTSSSEDEEPESDLFTRATNGRLLKGSLDWSNSSSSSPPSKMQVKIVEGKDFETLFYPEGSVYWAAAGEGDGGKGDDGERDGKRTKKSKVLEEQVHWMGYACARDATTSSLADLYSPPPSAPLSSSSSSSPPTSGLKKEDLPPWHQMIEVRYGLGPGAARGRGLGTMAQGIVMRWAAQERGATRFIAETEKENVASKKVLGRLGFREVVDGGRRYFGEEVVDWERWV